MGRYNKTSCYVVVKSTVICLSKANPAASAILVISLQ